MAGLPYERGALHSWLGILELCTVGLLALSSCLGWAVHGVAFASHSERVSLRGFMLSNPARDLPLGIVLACVLTMCVYVAMSASVLLVASPAARQRIQHRFRRSFGNSSVVGSQQRHGEFSGRDQQLEPDDRPRWPAWESRLLLLRQGDVRHDHAVDHVQGDHRIELSRRRCRLCTSLAVCHLCFALHRAAGEARAAVAQLLVGSALVGRESFARCLAFLPFLLEANGRAAAHGLCTLDVLPTAAATTEHQERVVNMPS